MGTSARLCLNWCMLTHAISFTLGYDRSRVKLSVAVVLPGSADCTHRGCEFKGVDRASDNSSQLCRREWEAINVTRTSQCHYVGLACLASPRICSWEAPRGIAESLRLRPRLTPCKQMRDSIATNRLYVCLPARWCVDLETIRSRQLVSCASETSCREAQLWFRSFPK